MVSVIELLDGCHKLLVRLVAFRVSFLRGVQATKLGTCLDMQIAAGVRAALTTARQAKARSQCTSSQSALYEI